jgi:hypothetical protein
LKIGRVPNAPLAIAGTAPSLTADAVLDHAKRDDDYAFRQAISKLREIGDGRTQWTAAVLFAL